MPVWLSAKVGGSIPLEATRAILDFLKKNKTIIIKLNGGDIGDIRNKIEVVKLDIEKAKTLFIIDGSKIEVENHCRKNFESTIGGIDCQKDF
ncbi:hypothetical protein H8356DRAFT_1343809 [Neocallimastix lanati (nom. inval.)]|nr:hypothetical protein H8356DRAFT_1343809 [Neocallimastix sp. JGI-2020a]